MEEYNNVEAVNLVDNVREHFVLKRFLIIVGLVIITAGVTFSITWYIIADMENKNTKINDTLNANLQSQIDTLRDELNK